MLHDIFMGISELTVKKIDLCSQVEVSFAGHPRCVQNVSLTFWTVSEGNKDVPDYACRSDAYRSQFYSSAQVIHVDWMTHGQESFQGTSYSSPPSSLTPEHALNSL